MQEEYNSNKTEDAGPSNQYLTFSLGEEEYGLDILRVQEIIGYVDPTPIPGMPEFVTGVVNLRGLIIPVVDARAMFRMPVGEYSKFSAIIVVDAGENKTGIIVDTVTDVFSISQSNIKPPPGFAGPIRTDCISGLGQRDDRLIILLEVDQLLKGSLDVWEKVSDSNLNEADVAKATVEEAIGQQPETEQATASTANDE
ncbi:MAG: chemotaxis protein CheW [Planctomycetes bacterium]|nr:chemotaxis protein CheW [Planctomycetota bacterium]